MSCSVIGSHTLEWIDASPHFCAAGVPSFGDWNNLRGREEAKGEDLDEHGVRVTGSIPGFNSIFKQGIKSCSPEFIMTWL